MRKLKLGEIATFVNGYAFKPSDWKDEGVPIIRIQNLTGSMDTQNYYQGNIDSKYDINTGDVLISWSASLGVYMWSGEKAYLNQHIFKVVFDKIDIDKNFFMILIESKLNELKSRTHGSTMKHITKKDFDNIEVNMPEIEEQKSIADKILKTKMLIKNKKEQNIKLEELKKSKFSEMFKNEEEKVELNNVCKFINGDRGKNYPSVGEISKKGEIPFINAGLLDNGKVNFKNMNYISKEKYDSLSSGKIQKNDILYCLRGSLGKNAIIDFEQNGAIASSLLILRPNTDKIMPQYLFNILTTNEILIQQAKALNGSSQPNLSATSVKKYTIALPTIEKQNQFVNVVEIINKKKEQNDAIIEKLENLHVALINENL